MLCKVIGVSLSAGQLFDGFDDEYQCPVLDEDRVSIMPLVFTFYRRLVLHSIPSCVFVFVDRVECSIHRKEDQRVMSCTHVQRTVMRYSRGGQTQTPGPHAAR